MLNEPMSAAVPLPVRAGASWRVHFFVVSAAILAIVGLSLFVPKAGDLPFYLTAAERMRQGESIYRTEESGWTYPPFFGLPMMPLVDLPKGMQRTLWFTVSVAMLVASLYLLRRWLIRLCLHQGDRPRAEIGFWLVVFVSSVFFLTSPLQGLTHDLAILLLVTLAVDALCAEREGWAGLWAGLGAACKATPLLFALVFLWQRRFRALAVMTVAMVGATLLPDVLYPQKSGELWSASWAHTFLLKLRPGAAAHAAGAWTEWNPLNQSLAGTLHRLTTHVPAEECRLWDRWNVSVVSLDQEQRKWLILGGQLGVVLLLLAATRRGRGRLPSEERWPCEDRWLRTLAEGGAVASAMLLLSPMSSKPHFCTLVLPLAAAWMCHCCRRRAYWLVGWASLATLLSLLAAKDLVGGTIGSEIAARGAYTLAALCGLLVSADLAVRWRAFAAAPSCSMPSSAVERRAA